MNKPRTIEGRWWLFGDRRRPHFGVLKYAPETGLRLEVKIAEVRDEDALLGASVRPADVPSVIHGRDEHNRPVTLFGCHRHRWSNSAGLRTFDVSALRGILGNQFSSWKEAKYRHVRAHFTLLHPWMERSHPYWQREVTKERPAVAFRSAHSSDITATLDNDTVISLVAEGGTKSNWEGHTFTEGHFATVELPEPLAIGDLFREYIGPLRQFLTLFIGSPVFVEDVLLPQEDSSPESPHELLQGNHGVGAAKRDEHMPLVPFSEVSNNLPVILKKWFEYRSRLDSTLTLYFATVFNRSLYVDHRFLFLAQALETYHNDNPVFNPSILSKAAFRQKRNRILNAVPRTVRSWLKEQLHHANQKTLANRLDDILNQHPQDVSKFIKNRTTFAEKVRHTRNFYTHFDKELERKGKIAKGNELLLLTERMRALLQICVLRDLGIGDSAVSRIVGRFGKMEMVSIEE